MAGLNKGHTVVHEMGHYFGLSHTFSSVKGTCSIDSDDGVDDTPLEANPNYGCTRTRDTCPNDKGFDPTWSFMDYSPDACMSRFSPGQMVRMREMMDTYRTKLVSTSKIDHFFGETPPCTNKTAEVFCNGRGIMAIAGGECRCAGCIGGYTGNHCEVGACDGKTTVGYCNGRGQPTVAGNACVCSACTGGFTGDACEKSACYGHTAASLCYNRGRPAIIGFGCGCTDCSNGFTGEWCQDRIETTATSTTATQTTTTATTTIATRTTIEIPRSVKIRSAPASAYEGELLEVAVAYSSDFAPVIIKVEVKAVSESSRVGFIVAAHSAAVSNQKSGTILISGLQIAHDATTLDASSFRMEASMIVPNSVGGGAADLADSPSPSVVDVRGADAEGTQIGSHVLRFQIKPQVLRNPAPYIPHSGQKSCDELEWRVHPGRTRPANKKVCSSSNLGAGNCYNKGDHDWMGAYAVCAVTGGRLCTLAEVSNNLASATGCGLDGKYVWTSTPCAGGFFIAPGNAKDEKLPTCHPFDQATISVRCCSDTDPVWEPPAELQATVTADPCSVCPTELDPVCVHDHNIQYRNWCFATCNREGKLDFSNGPCPPTLADIQPENGKDCSECAVELYDPVCTEAGAEFYNECFLTCHTDELSAARATRGGCALSNGCSGSCTGVSVGYSPVCIDGQSYFNACEVECTLGVVLSPADQIEAGAAAAAAAGDIWSAIGGDATIAAVSRKQFFLGVCPSAVQFPMAPATAPPQAAEAGASAAGDIWSVIASDAIIGGTAGAVCYDLPLFDGNAWADLDGDGCSSYTARSWCDAVGNEGDGWGLGGDTMEDFAVSGLSAAKACCGCGGGFQPDRLPTDGDGKGPTQDESDAAVAIADLLTCSECPTEANLVCASDQTFFNPCFAQCTNHPTFQGGVCASSVVEAGGNDGSPSGQLPIIVGCPSDATAHFTSRGMKKLKKAIKTRIGKRLKKLSAAECAQICADLVECLSFEYFINKKQCDIYAGSAATIGMKRAFKKSTVQEHYERSLFCRGPRTAEG